jgi:hypothetical protein
MVTAMLMLTTETLPQGYKILDLFGLIQATHSVQVSEKGLIDSITKRNPNEYEEALANFGGAAPPGANLLYVIKVTSAVTPPDRSGRYFLILTYIGTAARVQIGPSS